MSNLHPLRFQPLFRQYIWGGRRLGTVLDKPIGDAENYAESWEVVDHGEDQSVVAFGELAGQTLGRIGRECGESLYGRHDPQSRFPLLFKFLDANRKLSVQVHPNDAAAALQDPPDLGKTEAWVVMAAEPGSVIYAGLKRGFDRAALEREVVRGTTELCLHKVEPKVGDCIFLPAGIVHALGEGLVVAEIQQASDTTYRLFDWNRVDADGSPRQLHIEQGLQAIDYDAGPVEPQITQDTEAPHVSRLVMCDKFVLDRWTFDGEQTIGGDNRFHVLAVLQGTVDVEGDPSGQSLALGETTVLPASLGSVRLTASDDAVMLDMYLP